MIPILAWSRSEKKLMPFPWMIAQGTGWGQKRSLIEGDIEIVKNTSEEITEVVLEMDQRLNGTWIETDVDIELQNRFKKLRVTVPKWQVQEGVRIGADFLRRYQHLL
jgi:putative glycosyltransferase (TIGR04372 family)